MGQAKKKLVIAVTEDGDLKVNASEMDASEKEILDLLKELAVEFGGDVQALKIEKHVHKHGGAHVHKTAVAGKG